MFCSLCGNELTEAPVVDVLVTRYRCANGHLFYDGERPRGVLPDPRRVREPRGVTDRQLVEFWLADPAARTELPDDLAEVCRRLIDIESIDFAPQREFWPWPVKFCFVCGGAVTRHGKDIYLDGYLCDRGHQTWERGGDIYLAPAEGEQHVRINIETQPFWAARLAEHWLEDSKHKTPYISPALREAIRRLRPTLGSSETPS